jgi:hypothetical protein
VKKPADAAQAGFSVPAVYIIGWLLLSPRCTLRSNL